MVSFTWEQNVALTDGGSVTVFGLNFRTSSFSPSSEFEANACATAAWASKTSLTCRVVVGKNAGTVANIAVTASGAVGTRSYDFSFDGTAFSLFGGN